MSSRTEAKKHIKAQFKRSIKHKRPVLESEIGRYVWLNLPEIPAQDANIGEVSENALICLIEEIIGEIDVEYEGIELIPTIAGTFLIKVPLKNPPINDYLYCCYDGSLVWVSLADEFIAQLAPPIRTRPNYLVIANNSSFSDDELVAIVKNSGI